jgi:hypothetical protein
VRIGSASELRRLVMETDPPGIKRQISIDWRRQWS